MDIEYRVFRWLAGLAFILFSIIQIKALKADFNNHSKLKHPPNKFDKNLLGLLFTIKAIILIAYFIFPSYISFGEFYIPKPFRYFSFLAILAVIFAIKKTRDYLGKEFSNTIAIKAEHKLITSGIYKRIRHPIYTFFILFHIFFTILVANIFVGGLLIMSISFFIFFRIQIEEKMLLNQFQDAYKTYQANSGFLFPKLRK